MKYIPKFQKAGKLPILPTWYNYQAVQDNTARRPIETDIMLKEEQIKRGYDLRVKEKQEALAKYRNQPGMVSGMKQKPTQSDLKEYATQAVSYNDKLRNDPVGTLGPDLAMSFIPELLMLKGPSQAIGKGLNYLNPFKVKLPMDKISIPFAKNLADLEYTNNYFSKFGYKLNTSIEELAKNDVLTNNYIKSLVNQHNTFARGVSTNWKVIEKRNPEILRHLEGVGIDYINYPQKAAEYMATHVPIKTGYGRASLNEHVFKAGKDGLYTSNSLPTAEGYTYGDGFVVKAKRFTDFSSKNRQDWINNNELKYFEYNIPIKSTKRRGLATKTTLNDSKNILKTEHLNINVDDILKDIDSQKWLDVVENVIPKLAPTRASRSNVENLISLDNEIYDGMERMAARTKRIDVLKEYVKNIPKSDGYAHYIHIGTPGEQILEPIETIRITPEIWKNKSRAHTNIYSEGLSAGSFLPILGLPSLFSNK